MKTGLSLERQAAAPFSNIATCLRDPAQKLMRARATKAKAVNGTHSAVVSTEIKKIFKAGLSIGRSKEYRCSFWSG